MPRDDRSTGISAADPFTTTLFREDGSALLVTVGELAFDECRIAPSPAFMLGERVRLHLHGQGWIEAQVQLVSDGQARLLFVTKSRC